MAVRVFVADSHPVFVAGLHSTLAEDEDFDVCGGVASREDIASGRCGARGQADVVLTDISLADCWPSRACDGGRPAPPRLLLVAGDVTEKQVVAALRSGAHGLLPRDVSPSQLRRAIALVAEGGMVFERGAAERLRRCAATWGDAAGDDEPFPSLTGRERQVLELLARGQGNRRIARQLTLTEKTVRNHVSNILGKLGVSSRAEAAVLARRSGVPVGVSGDAGARAG
jgi:DNA-binding NarL/FixJ family response regulator